MGYIECTTTATHPSEYIAIVANCELITPEGKVITLTKPWHVDARFAQHTIQVPDKELPQALVTKYRAQIASHETNQPLPPTWPVPFFWTGRKYTEAEIHTVTDGYPGQGLFIRARGKIQCLKFRSESQPLLTKNYIVVPPIDRVWVDAWQQGGMTLPLFVNEDPRWRCLGWYAMDGVCTAEDLPTTLGRKLRTLRLTGPAVAMIQIHRVAEEVLSPGLKAKA